jgi:hypothetical protein
MWATNLFLKNKLVAHLFNKDHKNKLINLILSLEIVLGIVWS